MFHIIDIDQTATQFLDREFECIASGKCLWLQVVFCLGDCCLENGTTCKEGH
jgi:hypothetical protein